MFRSRRFFSTLKTTSLNQWHKDKGARMVDFCGWEMPISYYKDSIIESHMFTRSKATIFDVSHMLQLKIAGEYRFDFLEKLVSSDIKGLKPGTGCLSLLTSKCGGIIDDTIITSNPGHLLMVCNAGRAREDIAHLNFHLDQFKRESDKPRYVNIENLSEKRSLIALQGPDASKILGPHITVSKWNSLFNRGNILNHVKFMSSFECELFGKNVYITRCGYTGEDGFEISMLHEDAVDIVDNLVGDEHDVRPAGLGARDTLRLESGLCLYGNDIDLTTTPVEASLMWTIPKKRRDVNYPIKFLGWDNIMKEFKEKSSSRKRVGITFNGKRPISQGSKIITEEGLEVGVVTSGTLSPVLKKGIGMAYMTTPIEKNNLHINIRGKKLKVDITKMPFVPSNYFI
jgi:glycine cleavage system T protein (aminomethyltransferase)